MSGTQFPTEPFSYEDKPIQHDIQVGPTPTESEAHDTEKGGLPILSHLVSFALGAVCTGIVCFLLWPAPTPRLAGATPPPGDEPIEAVAIQEDPVSAPETPAADPPAQAPPAGTYRNIPDPTRVPGGQAWIDHRVQPGETIRNLSAKYGVDAKDLYLKNGGRFVPRVGQTIKVPKFEYPSHRVKPGDTLFAIAARYDTDIQSLRDLNGLTTSNLKVGQPLRVR
ncbi:LysM peptidoglycan-binding domain-containing protein [Sulfidibacter corallicola]|uniref:LysM peptidoglycan-binding domain-containing protein n=1 Tax=Sulfidibacter corallicola TaxID=2818388 RepID=A0A8A4U5A7_SULCO|nr:LysM peptidoglycan-binding domain-containing protein [Sulfidibacter corallicola]QTD53925.1 LysM peptidoglycan-binding domain-containing protein [Sulfidibacter corallicola]